MARADANEVYTSVHLTAIVAQPANTERVMETVISRQRGTGTMTASMGSQFTKINVLAFPV